MKDQDLTLVGLTDDGTKLVLVSASGEEFTVPADARLRAVLGPMNDHLEIKMESALRPRDIQARIRAGETPESVAAAAQTTIDRVMGYATPVLAERAHVAERAQRASVRRKTSEGPSRVLGDAVAERLRERNIDPGTVAWDAWRREDGRWALIADYRSGENPRHAEFIFDAPGRYVLAEDEEARWLVGERTANRGPQPRPTTPAGTPAGTPGGAPPARRLTAVSSDDELPLGEDALDLVSDGPDQPAEPATADADWIATQASDRPRPDAAEDASAPGPGDDEQAEQPRKPARKKGRASVPSWDEIMFGGERRE